MTPRNRRVPRRGWTLILVPPRPGAPTRQVTVSTRSLATVGLCALAVVTAAATWTGENSLIAASSADRLVATQRTVVALLDSVAALHYAVVRDSQLPPRRMILPVTVGTIASPFSVSRFHPLLQIFRAHLGVDLAAPSGTPIMAAAPARVRSVGWRLAYGLTIELEHTGGVVTRYAHCRSARVHPGDVVAAGDIIGTVGSSGLATGPHVHFEVLVDGSQVDPIRYLAASRAAAQNSVRGEEQ